MPRNVEQREQSQDGTGPWIQLAAFCDQIVEDKSGVLSLIRVVDRVIKFSDEPEPPEEMPPFERDLQMVIALKPERALGRKSLHIELHTPDGMLRKGPKIPVVFESEDRGVNLIIPSRFRFEMEGVHWFSVRCDGQLLTRLPLRVVYSPTPRRVGPGPWQP